MLKLAEEYQGMFGESQTALAHLKALHEYLDRKIKKALKASHSQTSSKSTDEPPPTKSTQISTPQPEVNTDAINPHVSQCHKHTLAQIEASFISLQGRLQLHCHDLERIMERRFDLMQGQITELNRKVGICEEGIT